MRARVVTVREMAAAAWTMLMSCDLMYFLGGLTVDGAETELGVEGNCRLDSGVKKLWDQWEWFFNLHLKLLVLLILVVVL